MKTFEAADGKTALKNAEGTDKIIWQSESSR